MANQEAESLLSTAEPVEEVVLVVDADVELVLSSLTEKFVGDARQPQREQPCTIYKVLERIRNEDAPAYDPQLVSIGPYHHGSMLLLPMERLKRQFLRDLISRHKTNTLSNYITALSSAVSVSKTSKYYSELIVRREDINSFVEMMVLDGCFIIEFYIKSLLGDNMGELDFVNWNRSLVENDLLLLENQIPFSVLECLFAYTVIPGLTDTTRPLTLKELAACCVSRDRQHNVQPIPEVVHHLLHLRHSSLAPTVQNTSHHIQNKCCSCLSVLINKMTDALLHSFFLVLTVFLRCCRPRPLELKHRAPRSMPSATELQEAGIRFQVQSQPGSILDVTFRKHDGVMEIPLVSIQAVTVSQFRNLVAFEQCFPEAGSHFTSYVALMDNLIDTREDVTILEHSGVLESKLGGDEEVCCIFNNLGKGSYLNYETHYLVDLFREVKEYYGTERHRWRARMVRDYFSNPWSIMSLIAAIVLLLLTIMQTFFAVYGYYRPPQPH